MTPHTRFGKVCDLIGAGALAAAAGALGGALYLNAAESATFSTLFAAMAIAICAFCTGRVADITQVLAQHEDPRRRRIAPIPATNLVAVSSAADTEQNADLPRAA